MGQVFGAESLVPDDVKARYAKRAAVQCATTKARLREPSPPRPQADPFEVLGGD